MLTQTGFSPSFTRYSADVDVDDTFLHMDTLRSLPSPTRSCSKKGFVAVTFMDYCFVCCRLLLSSPPITADIVIMNDIIDVAVRETKSSSCIPLPKVAHSAETSKPSFESPTENPNPNREPPAIGTTSL